MKPFVVIIISFLLISIACLITYSLITTNINNRANKNRKDQNKKSKGIIDRFSNSEFVNSFSSKIPTSYSKIETIFNRSKNPWDMTIPVFQFIRYFGLISLSVIALIFVTVSKIKTGVLFLGLGVLMWYYPLYFYTETGNEREEEWNKMYEFIWVIKHNIMLYGPAKAYMNVKSYIESNAPHNLELIQGFEDFYNYWSPDEISEYIEKYYPFSIPREITQILFNMNKTGEFPDEELSSLRMFIINTQNLSVEKILSSVSSKATIFSLPFLMITVIIALMVPLVLQIVNIM